MAANPKPGAPQVPFRALAINVLGTLLATAGVVALFVPDLVRNIPALADPLTAAALVVVGVSLDAWSVLAIVKGSRTR